jgi:hypothetical protein
MKEIEDAICGKNCKRRPQISQREGLSADFADYADFLGWMALFSLRRLVRPYSRSEVIHNPGPLTLESCNQLLSSPAR